MVATLDQLGVGQQATITVVSDGGVEGATEESVALARRLLEFGFFAGENVELMKRGPIGADPLCVRVGNSLVALRERDARAVQVEISS